jgi:tRNA pseudouridine13 synthase
MTEHKELDGETSAVEISWARPGKNNERRRQYFLTHFRCLICRHLTNLSICRNPAKPVDLNPPYIHFTLQKTNRETQDALSIISYNLRCNVSKDLAISGTKDKRSVSCQRVSLKRGKRTVGDIWASLNNIRRNQKSDKQVTFTQRGDKGIRVGDFTYETAPLKLGELNGNRFTVVLR